MSRHSTEKVYWDIEYLKQLFPEHFYDELIDSKVLVERRNNMASLSFNILGSNPKTILDTASEEITSYRELVGKLKNTKITSPQLKQILVFLFNFRLLQFFVSPASGLTYICVEGNAEVERSLDIIFDQSEHVEAKFQYIFDPENIRKS